MTFALVGFPIAAMGACASEPGADSASTGVTPMNVTSGGPTTSNVTSGGPTTSNVTSGGPTTSGSTDGSPTTSGSTDGSPTTSSTTGGAGGSSSVTTDGGSTDGASTDGVGGMMTTDGGPTTTGDPMPDLTLPELVGDLDGRIIYTPCGDNPTTDDCAGDGWYTNDGERHACQGALDANVYHDIGGEDGVEYQVTFHFYAIAEPKVYGNGVTRDAGGRPNLDGGDPIPWATAPPNHQYPSSNYNTYEIRVRDTSDQEVGVYYLNADTQEGHYTMLVDYEKTITLIGGGSVHVRVFDANCRQIKNCGTSAGFPCSGKVRDLNLASVDPAPPAHFVRPGLGESDDHAGQWVVIDALSFTE